MNASGPARLINPRPTTSGGVRALRKAATIVGIVGLSAVLLTGCGSSSSSTTGSGGSSSSSSGGSGSGSSSSSSQATLTIKDYKYTVPASVKPGEKITVKNEDSEAHTVTTDSGNTFNVSAPANSSTTFTAPKKAGSYKFHCTFHSNMHGTLVVK